MFVQDDDDDGGEKPFKWVSKLTHFRKLFIHTYNDRRRGVFGDGYWSVCIGWLAGMSELHI